MVATQELDVGRLIGLVVSENLHRGGDLGYGLVITRDTIVGAKKLDSWGDFEAYLGPGAETTETTVTAAKRVAEELIGASEFSIPVGSIGQVLFRKPGMFFGGYVIFKTSLSSIRIDMTVLSTNSPRLLETSKKLKDSLAMAVGDRLYQVGAGRR
ncbi:MAG: hypothetical protein OK449_04760 [Thaumarchaeota archaeon]|nr:hypothetical protein [Nitrososphaerota archaeon]